MAEPRYACRTCGTWTCDAPGCTGQRPTTGAYYCDYRCPRCWGLTGTLIPTMHTERMWHEHNTTPLPQGYPYGQRPPPQEWGAGFGPRTVAPTYQGVPLPGPEWKDHIDMRSWMQGVDDALQHTRREETL